MTSLSIFASKFLASGASVEPFHARQHSLKQSIDSPFAAPESSSRETSHDGDNDDDDVDDELGAKDRNSRHRQLPHLRAGGSSALLSHIIGQGPRAGKMQGIPDMGDEEEYDDDDDDVFRGPSGQRSRLVLPGKASSHTTPNASFTAGLDEQDPFLQQRDLQSKTSTKASTKAKSKGWLAHTVADSNASVASTFSPPKRPNRGTMSSELYGDPDDSDEEGVPARQGGRRTSSKGKGKANPQASIDESSTEASNLTSDDDRDASFRGGQRHQRGNVGRKGKGTSSYLREPLLSSAASEALDQPPGAYAGATSRLAAADIYTYPHPPAKSGWTPWAPGNRVSLSQYKDKPALLTWAMLCIVTLVVAGWMAIGAKGQSAPPSSPASRPSPYYTLTRSIPILFLLTFLSLAAASANLLVLRNISRAGGARILKYGLAGIPFVLILGWVWAFAGSFIYDDERWTGGAWTTTGLRVLSLIPLGLAIYFARSVWKRRDALNRSLSVLEMSATVVAAHPALLILSLASLLAFIATTAPFLTIFMRLFLRGHFGQPGSSSNVWHTDANARFMAWLTLGVWIWTWLVLRGIQRVTVAGVVSHWYFHRDAGNAGKVFDAGDAGEEDDQLPGPAPGEWLGEEQSAAFSAPSHVDVVRASFLRATGPALGTVCLSAFMLSLARVGIAMASSARWAHRKLSTSTRMPALLQPLTYVLALLAGVSALLQGLSDYALVYVGVTGDGFTAAARRSARLTRKQGVKSVMESLIINTVLDLTTLALCFLTGLIGFLISAHNLHVPSDAPLVGLLCAIMPYGTLRLCADVLANAADTLYLCFTIDVASGEQHCEQAAEAFGGKEKGAGLADHSQGMDDQDEDETQETQLPF